MDNYFGNDKFQVLKCMADRQIPINEQNVVKLSQQEIADIIGLSKPKVNSIIATLKKDGYIQSSNAKGKYILTEKTNIYFKSTFLKEKGERI